MSESGPSSWILRLQRWAEGVPNIRLALLVGSQARTDVPADALSDIDLALFARDPEAFLRDENWIPRLGPYWTSHVEGNALESGEERRVLFEDGQDVDFAVFPAGSISALITDPRAAGVLQRGFRTLVNKDSVDLVVSGDRPRPTAPTSSDFSNLVNDYWFHLVWTAKKLLRGELMTAMEATNGYLRSLLVRMARWHAVARGPKGQDVWHAARFFEKWADPRVIRELPDTVARYEPRSIAHALRANRALFGWLAGEVRESRSFASPLRDERGLSSHLERLLAEFPQ